MVLLRGGNNLFARAARVVSAISVQSDESTAAASISQLVATKATTSTQRNFPSCEREPKSEM